VVVAGLLTSCRRFRFVTLVDEQGGIATVVHDELRAFVARMRECRERKVPNSSSDSPLCAKTGMPAFATAAAAWSCVEKMLQLAQRTDAPSSTSVSMRMAVSMVCATNR